MNINDMKLGDIKKLMEVFGSEQSSTLNRHSGQKVIIRTCSAGVWFGKLVEKSGNEVILEDARRMYYWKAKKSISLSGVAIEGIDVEESKIISPVKSVWLEAIEILELSSKCIKDLDGAPYVEAD